MARFDDLPDELQLKIFEIAACRDCQPRIVEIYFKSGDVYSRTLPPPLLHVCKLSRWVVLKKYKPWLPQFKSKPWHVPYERLVQKHGLEKLSRLSNVCIDLENDMLLINKQQWSKWDFGYLEERKLRHLSVNLNGWIHWKAAADLLQQFRKLRRASIYDSGSDDLFAQFKVEEIQACVLQAEKKRAEKGSSYAAPLIDTLFMPDAITWDGAPEDWYTYKYSRGYKSRRSQARSESSNDLDRFAGIFGNWASGTSGRNKRIQTEQRPSTRHDHNMGGSISKAAFTTRTLLPAAFADPSNPRDAPVPAQHTGNAHKSDILTRILPPATFLNNPSSESNLERNGRTGRDSEKSALEPRKQSQDRNVAKCIAPSSAPLRKDSPNTSVSYTAIKRKRAEGPDAAASLLSPRKAAKTTGHKAAETSIEIKKDDKNSRQFIMPDIEDWDESDSASSRPSAKTYTQPVKYSDTDINHMMEEAQAEETGSKASWETSAEESFADIFEDIDFLRTPSPELNSGPLISSPLDLNSSLSLLSPPQAFDESEISYLDENVLSSNTTVSFSPSFVDPRAAFYDPFDQSESTANANLEKVTQENNQAFGILGSMSGTENFEESSHMEVPQERKAPPRQCPQVVIYQKTAVASNIGKSGLLATPNKSFPVPVVANPVKEGRGFGPDPKCLTLARLVSGELQYLVQWKDQSEESWVSEKSLLRSAPELVKEWKSRKAEAHDESKVALPILEYVVEKILSKKKFRGVPHYLVKWEGYPLERDRTWEPCDRLRIDVPTLVHEYESRNKRKRK